MPRSPLIPRQVLFGPPARLSPALSPSGRHVACLAPVEGVLNIWVGAAAGGGFRPVTHDRRRGIQVFAWAHDGRRLLYVQDRDGDENTHLYVVDPAGGPPRDLTPYPGVQARLIGTSAGRPGEVAVGLNLRRRELHDAYRIELATGRMRPAAENPGFVRWFTDSALRVRAANEVTPDGGSRIMVRDDEDASWRPLLVAGPDDAATTRPVAFTGDGGGLLALSSVGADTARVVSLDLVGGGQRVLYEDAEHDVVGLGLHPRSGKADLVVVQREHTDLHALDAETAADLERLRALAPGDVSVLGRDDADRAWLVQYNRDDGPAAYHVFDRVRGTGWRLFTHLPELERRQLARIEPFRFTARDGLVLHGYLTFPPGLERRALPAVLAVHGGPQSRDVWGFRAEPQWLANRGYLCVQVNFRGSTGYGKSFVAAGDREWGGRMLDDLVDAAAWTVDQGFADPARVGVYGSSYGGYAALAAAAFTSGVFRCAVSACGPSDLRTFIASHEGPMSSLVHLLHRRVGDPAVDGEWLRSRSPLSRAERIRIPLLIAQGANDPRVRRQEAEQLVEALRRGGVPHEYLLFPDEGHGLIRPRNRMRFYAAVERFLAEHLGGRHEPD